MPAATWRGLVSALLALGVVMATGCGADGMPRKRLGCLPFPGTFSLYTLADPEDLGRHRYEEWDNLTDGFAEAERGVLYTCRAGFLDLAHIREAIDWARYMQLRVEGPLMAGKSPIRIPGREQTTWTLNVSYPTWWKTIPVEERAAIAGEASRVIGLRMSYVVMTWHEIITWHGYKSTVVIPEDRSAFTYDDASSHVVGLYIADIAMSEAAALGWDRAVTRALPVVLTAMGVVPRERASEAVERVKGVWWGDEECLVRDAEFEPDGGAFAPRTVPCFSPCDDAPAGALPLPSLANVAGYDLRGMLSVGLESGILEMASIRRAAGVAPRGPISVQRDFPVLVDRVRLEAKQQ